MSNNWYQLYEGCITFVIGKSGSGKSILVARHSFDLDSERTLLVDAYNAYGIEHIQTFNRIHKTNYKGFVRSKHVSDITMGIEAGYTRIIIDEAHRVLGKKEFAELLMLNPSAHFILLVQDIFDLKGFGFNIEDAVKSYDSIGIKSGYETLVSAYMFKRNYGFVHEIDGRKVFGITATRPFTSESFKRLRLINESGE